MVRLLLRAFIVLALLGAAPPFHASWAMPWAVADATEPLSPIAHDDHRHASPAGSPDRHLPGHQHGPAAGEHAHEVPMLPVRVAGRPLSAAAGPWPDGAPLAGASAIIGIERPPKHDA